MPRLRVRVGHSGGMPGVATTLRLYPSENVAVIVLANRSVSEAVEQIARLVTEAVLPGYGARQRDGPLGRAAIAGVPGRNTFLPPRALRGVWTGRLETYSARYPVRLDVRADGVVAAVGD